MKHQQHAWLLAPWIAAAMLFLGACTSPQNAGEEVLPDGVEVAFTDTFTLGFRTIIIDSVPTGQLSRCLIGNYVDEEFGRINCQTYVQTRVTGSNLVFGTDPADLSLDSVVLTLDLLDFYGRYNDPLQLEVFRITEAFDLDKDYSSIDSLAVDGSYDFANGKTLDFSGLPGFYDYVCLRLDDSLGRYLLYAPVDSLVSQSTFTSYFKGLMIRTKAVDQQLNREPGGVFAFDPRSTKTSLTIHYHDGSSKESYTFPINDASRRFHKITRTESSGSLLENSVANGGLAAENGCLQAGTLVKLYVSAPGLANIDPAGIHRAELVLPVDPQYLGSENRYTPPSSLFLYVADSSGTAEYSTSNFNATAEYNTSEKAYILPITLTLQQILAGRLPNNGFIIVPGNNGVTVNRAVIAGPGHPDITLQPKIRVTYTKIPH